MIRRKALNMNDAMKVDDLHGAASLYCDDDPETPGFFNFIGSVFMGRYITDHHRTDLEKAISSYENSLRCTSMSDPEWNTRLSNLGAALGTRFEITGHIPDINKACLYFEPVSYTHL